MIEKALRENVRIIVRAYAKATGQPISQISREFYGNSGFLDRFFAGEQSVRLSKIDKMLERLAQKWPAEEPWPICPVIRLARPMGGRSSRISPRKSAAA
jgi:hypothetical protein